MSIIFHQVLFRPLLNALIFLYTAIPGNDFGVAIIVLTLLSRLILYPLNQKFIRSQKVISVLQPKLKEIQIKYKSDRQKQAQEILALYKAHKINPFSGFFAIIIQIPILFALFKVFRSGFGPEVLDNLYSFVRRPEIISQMFLGRIDLSQSNWLLAILAGLSQFVQSKMLQPKESPNQKKTAFSAISKQMTYTMPIVIVFIAWRLPAGIALYWVANTIFAIFQQYFANKKIKKEPKENYGEQ